MTSPPATLTVAEEKFEHIRRTVSLFVGPALFAILLLLPMPALNVPAHRLAAIIGWVLIYWIGEPIPIPATALLGPALCVVMGVASPTAVFAPFAHPIIFLFIGSFIIAEAMITHRLNERIAIFVLSHKALTRSRYGLIIGVGLIPLGMSMWISDSATTAMMYPILLGIFAAMAQSKAGGAEPRFQAGLLLTISYAALIGGIGTPVGTPPNLIGVGSLQKLAHIRISFVQWMAVAIPIMLVLACCLFAVISLRFRSASTSGDSVLAYARAERAKAGPWSRGERNTLVAFLVAVVLWVGPGMIGAVAGPKSEAFKFCEAHIPEGVASLIAALLLFLLPTNWKQRRFTLKWSDAQRIDWGTILLFGGGLSLGGLMFDTRLADSVGTGVVAMSGIRSLWGLTAMVTAMAIILTEMTSNTATASMLVPLAIALAKSLGVSPVPPTIGVCLGASMAFMLPVSTPSNAIVYGSGRVPITAMIRTGILMDILSFIVIVAGLRVLCPILGLV